MRMEKVARATLKVLGGGGRPIVLQYNPEASTFRISRTVELSEGETQNDPWGGGVASARGAPDTLNFTVLLDESVYKPVSVGDRMKSVLAQAGTSLLRTATMGLPIPISLSPSNDKDILAEFERLYRLTVPDGSDPPRPPVVVFSWGKFNFTGVFTSIDLDVGTVDPKGGFKRGKVSGTMSGRALKALSSAEELFEEADLVEADPPLFAGTGYRQRLLESEGD